MEPIRSATSSHDPLLRLGERPEVAAQWVVGRNLDENEGEPIGVRGAELDQPPWFSDRRFNEADLRGDKAALDGFDVPHLKPQFRRPGGWNVVATGQFEEAASQEEDDPPSGARAKLPHDVKAERIPIERKAAFIVEGMQQESTRKNLDGSVGHRMRRHEMGSFLWRAGAGS